MDKKLEKVTRLYGDRQTVVRMTDFSRNPDAGYYPVKGIGIITGEHIHGVQSSLTRHLILSVTRESVQNEVLGFYQRNWKILTTHIYDFIMWITKQYSQTAENISERMAMYRKEKDVAELPRYAEMYAVLSTTAEIFLLYSVNRNFLNKEAAKALLEEWKIVILQTIKSNESALKSKDWGELLKEVCQAIYESGEIEPLPSEEQKNYGERIFMDSEFIYLRLDAFLERAKKYLRLWGIEWPNFSKYAVLDKLEQADLIETRGKTEGKRTLKLPGSKKNEQRFLHIRLVKILERED